MILEGMTQTKWDALPAQRREALRDNSDLTKQLVGLEGWRVEVTDDDGIKRRFIVGKSTGWRPCHLEIKTTRSYGGWPAQKQYAQIRKISKVR